MHPALEADGLALYRPVLGLEKELPRELVGARRTRVTPGAAEERACDAVTGRGAFAFQFAVYLVAALVGPDARPTMPVAVSLSTIASAPKPTPGRDAPASSNDPL